MFENQVLISTNKSNFFQVSINEEEERRKTSTLQNIAITIHVSNQRDYVFHLCLTSRTINNKTIQVIIDLTTNNIRNMNIYIYILIMIKYN